MCRHAKVRLFFVVYTPAAFMLAGVEPLVCKKRRAQQGLKMLIHLCVRYLRERHADILSARPSE